MTKVLAVVSEFYNYITDDMAEEAKEYLASADIQFEKAMVPGSFEIPAAISFAVVGEKERYDGYLALGCVIRGETDHYDYVCREVARNIGEISVQHMVPIGFGVITADNIEQARMRSCRGVASNLNVARQASSAVIKMIELYKRFF